MIQRPLRLSFTGGEVSPWASSRVDLDMFSRSASRIENFMITPFGGLSRRPGFRFIDKAAVNTGEIRLIPFQYSTGDSFILELTPGLLRFFTQGALLKKATGSAYTLTTPWQDLSRLHVKQINDVVYFCSAGAPPKRLERYSDLNWVLSDIDWKHLPWRYNTQQDHEIVFSKTTLTSGGKPLYDLIVLDGSGYWHGNYGGKDYMRVTTMQSDINQWIKGETKLTELQSSCWPAALTDSTTSHTMGRLIYYKDADNNLHFYTCTAAYKYNESTSISADPADYPVNFEPGVPAAASLLVENKWEFRTNGTWKGEWIIKKSYDNGNSWITARSFYSAADSNFIASGDESDEPCLMRVYLAEGNLTQKPKNVNFRIVSHKVDHVFELMDPIVLGRSYRAKKLDNYDMASYGYTFDWSLSAFGSRNGYPGAMTWHQNRLVFAGTPTQPQTIWISKTDDYHNFRLGANDSDALELTMAAGAQNRIQWLHSQQRLFLGTTEGEWTLDTPDGRALTPSNARFICHSHQGSEGFMIIPMESSLVFVQKGGLKLRELSYNINSDGYATTDLTIFADHITESGIVDLCLLNDNTPALWIVKKDGQAITMTWIPGQNILAWNRQTLSGEGRFLSVAVLDGEDSDSHELWVAVERKTNGKTVRTVEMLGKRKTLPSMEATMTAESLPCYLDSCTEITQGKGSVLSGLDHLSGQLALAYPKGRPHLAVSRKITSTGKIDLEAVGEGSVWFIGLPYESLLATTPFDYPETVGQLKNHVDTQVKILHSHPVVEYSSTPGDTWYLTAPPVVYNGENTSGNTAYFSGYVELQQAVVHQEAPVLNLRTSAPHPLNLLSITPRITFGEDQ